MGLYELNMTPRFGFCSDVTLENSATRKIVWLVPHVIKHSANTEVITWRCNWGDVCKSSCIYAMTKENYKGIKVTQEILRKTDLTLTRD